MGVFLQAAIVQRADVENVKAVTKKIEKRAFPYEHYL